jgi:hypothetical protein
MMLRISANTSSKAKSAVTTCLYNLRQLTRAWQMYADDNKGIVPDNNTGSPTVWLSSLDYADPGSTAPAALTNTPFGQYAARPEIYKCPADLSTTRTANGMIEIPRTYSMNAAVGSAFAYWLPSPSYRTYTNLASITAPSPSQLFVFIEKYPDRGNDASFPFIMPRSLGSTELVDPPAAYHDYSTGLSFADGHVEMKHWVDRRTSPTIPYSSSNPPIFNTSQQNNYDILWLADRTSAKSQ